MILVRKPITNRKENKMKNFMQGVFWTLFVGMAAWIALDMTKVVAHYKQNQHMNEIVALSIDDLD